MVQGKLMKLNLRILVYLNPSNINKITHKFNLQQDSGFILVKNTILALNEIEDWHFYVLVPSLDCWDNKPDNVTLMEYPYVNDALNSRFHFDTNALLKLFNNYKHDIDLIWTMLPEHSGALKGFANKRREEIPVFSYINWMDYNNKGYAPSYRLRMLDGILNSDAVGIQSEHMLLTMTELAKPYEKEIANSNIHIINPKTKLYPHITPTIGNTIAFNHRISTESGFHEMMSLASEHLRYPIWVTNINDVPINYGNKVISKRYENADEYYAKLSSVRFGISYHVGYSMWSMSVLDLMAMGKVVLVPNKNAFSEMFPYNYPFYFSNEKEFLEKLEYLQSCDDDILKLWGQRNQQEVIKRFTWFKQAVEFSNLFYSMISNKTNKKTKSVFDSIFEYGAVTKGDLINKNITEFRRICSRSWNKTRIELMRDWGIKDNVSSEHTIFYVKEYDITKGVTKRPEKVMTPYEKKQREKKGKQK